MRKLSIALGLAGLALATLLIAWFGFDRVGQVMERLGWRGFAAYCGFHLALFAVLGWAWFALARRVTARRFWVFVWARMVRDGSGRLLPFSQLGGFILGARALALHGVTPLAAAATTIADVTAEFLAEVAFGVFGLMIMAWRAPHASLLLPIAAASALGIAACVGLVLVQRRGGLVGLVQRIGRRIAGERFGRRLDHMQAELDAIYADRKRLFLGLALHFLAWVGTGVGTWIAYRLFDSPIDLPAALALEALLHAALTASFVVPVGLGVQEAAYTGLGAIFGLPPEVSLGVSLLNRARDIALGAPVLMVWQGIEAKRLRESASV